MDLRAKWNARYRDLEPDTARPAQVLSENLHLLPAAGGALDLACGLGGNALLLARHELNVCAYDLSIVAVDKLNAYAQRQGLSLRAQCRDVQKAPPEPERFDVLVVSYFLARELTDYLIDALRPGGLLFYQTFIRDHVDAVGPSNPAFRLESNELLKLFAPLKLVFYREEGRIGDISRGFRNEAMLIGQKR
jgi:tellurite methyltransferase